VPDRRRHATYVIEHLRVRADARGWDDLVAPEGDGLEGVRLRDGECVLEALYRDLLVDCSPPSSIALFTQVLRLC
jgi:hypothetical protein